jgi:hypothetical protein
MTGQKTINIGVTGHLAIQNSTMIEESIGHVFKAISNRHPQEIISFYSPLSPGADLLAAKIAVELSIPLFVILPSKLFKRRS